MARVLPVWFGDLFTQRHSVAHYSRNLARGLWDLGYAVHVGKPPRDMPPFYWRDYYRYPNQIPSDPYLAIVSHASPLGPYPGSSARFLIEFLDSGRLYRQMSVSDYQQLTGLVLLSSTCQAAYASHGIDASVVVPGGVDTTVFDASVPPLDLKHLFAPEKPNVLRWGDAAIDGRKTVLFCGFLNQKKGADMLVRAFGAYWAKHDRDCVLLIKNNPLYHGDNSSESGWLSADKPRVIEENNTVGAPILYVEEDLSDAEYVRLMAAADVIAQPSRMEGFGLIGLEAMAMEKPLLATRHLGFTTYCDDTNSVLIDPDLVEVEGHIALNAEYPSDRGAAALARAFACAADGSLLEGCRRTARHFSWRHSAECFVEQMRSRFDIEIARRV